MKRGPTYHEQLRGIANQYMKSGEQWPASTMQIVRWAQEKGLWAPRPEAELHRFANELADAMREEVYTDAQGRRVRTKHAARYGEGSRQTMLWDDIQTAPREHMAMSVQNRRQQIVGDSYQLKQDVDSYNENGNTGAPLQLVLDFTDDVAELEILRRRD